MMPFLIKLQNIFLDVLFPPLCLNCKKYLDNPKEYICADCFSNIKLNNTLFCPVCKARLADNKKICHSKSLYLLAAASNYDDPIIQNLIHCFKYQSFKNLAPILGKLIIQYLNSLKLNNPEFRSYIIVPIPLHPRRERERGFNQAKLIAEFVARNFNLKLINEIKRIKNNKPQIKCRNSKERIKNAADCFKIKNPEAVRDKNIILVDDVFTSGATMSEAAKVLKQNGTRRIVALTVAKA